MLFWLILGFIVAPDQPERKKPLYLKDGLLNSTDVSATRKLSEARVLMTEKTGATENVILLLVPEIEVRVTIGSKNSFFALYDKPLPSFRYSLPRENHAHIRVNHRPEQSKIHLGGFC